MNANQVSDLKVTILDLDETEVSLAERCANKAMLLVFLRQFG
jgi:hypothetical protein